MKKILAHALVLGFFFALPFGLFAQQIGTGDNVYTIPAGSEYGAGAQSGDVSSNFLFNDSLGSGSGQKDLKWLIGLFIDLIRRVIPLIFAMSVVVILWGITQSLSGSDEKRTEGKAIIIWGVVGLFAMISIWGLVNILSGTFQLDNSRIVVPRV